MVRVGGMHKMKGMKMEKKDRHSQKNVMSGRTNLLAKRSDRRQHRTNKDRWMSDSSQYMANCDLYIAVDIAKQEQATTHLPDPSARLSPALPHKPLL